jgi:hypothetical protein
VNATRPEGGGSRGNQGFPRAHPGSSRALRAAGRVEDTTGGRADRDDQPSSRVAARVNEPRVTLVEPEFDGSPRRVNRQAVALVREEWRVVDRWWTEEPVSRRYFDVVLESGQNAVVYRDEEDGGWFMQRGA